MSNMDAVRLFVDELFDGEGLQKPLMRSPLREEVVMIRDLIIGNALHTEHMELALEDTELRTDWHIYQHVLPTLADEAGQGSVLVSLGITLMFLVLLFAVTWLPKLFILGDVVLPLLEVVK